MTKRERLLKALNHEQTDNVPYNISTDAEVRERLAQDPRGKELFGRIQNHLARCGLNLEQEEPPNNTYRDVFGCVWQRGNIFHLEEYPRAERILRESLDALAEPQSKAECLLMLGIIEYRRSAHNQASTLFEEALRFSTDRRGLSNLVKISL